MQIALLISSVNTNAVKVRNDEWVGARPDVGSTVLLWM
jgi:hypothetical protein